MKVKVEAELWEDEDSDSVERQVIKEAARTLVARAEKELLNSAQKMALEEIRTAIQPTIKRVVDGEWPITNSYGEPSGKTATIASMARDMLGRKVDRHGSKTFGEDMLRDAVSKAIGKEFAEEIKDMRKRFREQVDAILQSKIQISLAEAMGIKR